MLYIVWEIKDIEYTYKKCFAIFPKTIGSYRVWLNSYYKTWDYTTCTYSYIPHFFVYKEDVIKYIENKKKENALC